ncbi:MAG: magnesium transporter [Burkholderiales bacterium]
MNASASAAVSALNLRFLLDYPGEAAQRLELMDTAEVAALLSAQPAHAVVPVWEQLASDVEQAVIELLPDELVRHLLGELEPALAAALLSALDTEQRRRYLALLDPQIADELVKLMAYPQDSAGQLMDPRIVTLRSGYTAHEALTRLRGMKRRDIREIFVVDHAGNLEGRVQIQELAMAAPDLPLLRLRRKISAVVTDTAPREEVVELLERSDITDLPVVDFSGRLVGVIRQSALVSAAQEEASIDIQTMVGASKDERALSKATFAVKRRLPWLHINLLTAFLAASVVGLFEGTIAKFTALAVLMPVVAGQAGNAGAQALAVTMRGLALREISLRHWPRVVIKEIGVGFMNGLAVAATTAAGVYIWSGSVGLMLVIASAMVIAMVAAGFAGATVPIMLSRFGQDPATASSIFLTTVTDIVGFFSFLGIATLLAGMLPQ